MSFIDLKRAQVHMIVCTAHVRVHFWVYKLNRVSSFSLDYYFNGVQEFGVHIKRLRSVPVRRSFSPGGGPDPAIGRCLLDDYQDIPKIYNHFINEKDCGDDVGYTSSISGNA